MTGFYAMFCVGVAFSLSHTSITQFQFIRTLVNPKCLDRTKLRRARSVKEILQIMGVETWSIEELIPTSCDSKLCDPDWRAWFRSLPYSADWSWRCFHRRFLGASLISCRFLSLCLPSLPGLVGGKKPFKGRLERQTIIAISICAFRSFQ